MIRGLVFDFDGLMVETESPAYASWAEVYREHGCELPLSRWAAGVGGSGMEFDPCAYLEDRLGYPLDRAAIRARRWQRKLELVAALPLLPGIAAYLDGARRRGLKLGVASSSSREWVLGHLDRLRVSGLFDAIICADDVARVKPDPEIYRTVVAALALRPEQVIVLEDSPNGVLAATRAGLFCVAVPNPITGRLPLDHADLRLTSLADVALDTLLATAQHRMLATGRRDSATAPARTGRRPGARTAGAPGGTSQGRGR